jgi:hypothetical protein
LPSGAPEQLAQLVLGGFETLALGIRQITAGAVDVERQHRHRRRERRQFPTFAAFGRRLQGFRNRARVAPREHPGFEIERIAMNVL